MTNVWSPHDLARIDAAHELHIAVRRADDTLRRWTPIWVVCTVGQVYVRTWYLRDTGWYGAALRTRSARIRVPELEADVTVDSVGDHDAALRQRIDAAYRTKYGHSGSVSMVNATAAGTTLQLSPIRDATPMRLPCAVSCRRTA